MKSAYPTLVSVLLLSVSYAGAADATPAAASAPTPAPAAAAAASSSATFPPVVATNGDKLAPKPLYRDPVYDGAADPTIIYNPTDKKWYMFYTNRRANVPGLSGVGWVHGSPIGIATSEDGATWKYLGLAKINDKDAVPDPTWWAPAVVEHNGVFHMFLSYVPGTFSDGWNHPRDIIHLTSKDLINWDYQSTLPLSSHKVIDPGVLHMPDGTWRLYYKDEANGSTCNYAESKDLDTWTDHGKVPGLSDAGGEAPLPFHWKGHYWFLRDITGGRHGLALYRSDDATNWTRVSTLLQNSGSDPADNGVGHHPEIIISNDRAYMFYFTQTGRPSYIQVVELKYDAANNVLTADRDAPTMINLQPPKDVETESKFE